MAIPSLDFWCGRYFLLGWCRSIYRFFFGQRVGLPERYGPLVCRKISVVLLGRRDGWSLLRLCHHGKIAPNRYLAFNATAAVALLGVSMLAGKASADIAMWALLAIGFFNSIMFPTIFSLATKGLGRFTSSASGVLCTAIVGGAVVPVVQGWVADTYSLMISFVVSAICYVYIVFFAIKGYKADE